MTEEKTEEKKIDEKTEKKERDYSKLTNTLKMMFGKSGATISFSSIIIVWIKITLIYALDEWVLVSGIGLITTLYTNILEDPQKALEYINQSATQLIHLMKNTNKSYEECKKIIDDNNKTEIIYPKRR